VLYKFITTFTRLVSYCGHLQSPTAKRMSALYQ